MWGYCDNTTVSKCSIIGQQCLQEPGHTCVNATNHDTWCDEPPCWSTNSKICHATGLYYMI